MKYLRPISIAVFLLLVYYVADAQTKRTTRLRLGVTLSGGGAKGLAHIGILKAIDSAGLRVDYVTGTSMGAIIGALYACGYSGDSIELIARRINWDALLSNSASLRSMGMDEKDEYDKFAVELPWVNHGFRLPSGMLESQELWLKFSEFFFPAYRIKDFSKLPRAFKCVAADVSNGEAVVMEEGEIVSAVRSSMAIPTVFTAVNYQGRKLVDGGIVRNFPVRDAKRMGADYVIGSNVSGSLLPKEKITNAFQILLQIAFFREDEDTKKEKQVCDLYVGHELDDYSMGSFGSSDEIIDEGIAMGRKMYPAFKHLADSLNQVYGPDTRPTPKLQPVQQVRVTQYEVNGLSRTGKTFFIRRMQFVNNEWYTAASLAKHIRMAFGTRYYQKIVYRLEPLTDSTNKIIFEVEEHPFTFAKLGIHYNTFSGISMLGNLTSRNFFTPYSRSMVTVNVGENMHIKGEHLQYFGKFKNFSANAILQLGQVRINTFNQYKQEGVYRQAYFKGEMNAKIAWRHTTSTGIGTRFEALNYSPDLASRLEAKGSSSFTNSYYFFDYNSLSNNVYPRKGLKLHAEAGYIYNVNPKFRFYNRGTALNMDSMDVNFKNFMRTSLFASYYTPISRRITLIQQLQAGINFNDHQGFLNGYYVGGLSNNEMRNQITFAGLQEGALYSGSVATMQLGVRYQMYGSIFLTGRANLLYHDFINTNKKYQLSGYLTGYALTFGYNFLLGPLEISAMYCDQSQKLLPYVNLAIPF
jgi:NTE family protein